MTYQKQQSPNWARYHDFKFEYKDDGSLRKNFPYDEKFPKTPYDIINARFELLLISGERCEAIVDYSREWMSEGLEWKLKTPTDLHDIGENVERWVVVAWKEK